MLTPESKEHLVIHVLATKLISPEPINPKEWLAAAMLYNRYASTLIGPTERYERIFNNIKENIDEALAVVKLFSWRPTEDTSFEEKLEKTMEMETIIGIKRNYVRKGLLHDIVDGPLSSETVQRMINDAEILTITRNDVVIGYAFVDSVNKIRTYGFSETELEESLNIATLN